MMLPDLAGPASTILVVDDEEFLLEYIRIVLLRSGFKVLTAQTGEAAWHFILHSQNEIRLVLTDIVMPGSFDGFKLGDRVRRRHLDLPVVFMTGADLAEYDSDDALASKRLLLRKPFNPEQLLAIVRENLVLRPPKTQNPKLHRAPSSHLTSRGEGGEIGGFLVRRACLLQI